MLQLECWASGSRGLRLGENIVVYERLCEESQEEKKMKSR